MSKTTLLQNQINRLAKEQVDQTNAYLIDLYTRTPKPAPAFGRDLVTDKKELLDLDLKALRATGDYAIVFRGAVVDLGADRSEMLRRYYKFAKAHPSEHVEFVPPVEMPTHAPVIRGYRGNTGRDLNPKEDQ